MASSLGLFGDGVKRRLLTGDRHAAGTVETGDEGIAAVLFQVWLDLVNPKADSKHTNICFRLGATVQRSAVSIKGCFQSAGAIDPAGNMCSRTFARRVAHDAAGLDIPGLQHGHQA